MEGRRSNGKIEVIFAQPFKEQDNEPETPRPPKIRAPSSKVFNKKPQKTMVIQPKMDQPRTQIRIKHRQKSIEKQTQEVDLDKGSQPTQIHQKKQQKSSNQQNLKQICQGKNISASCGKQQPAEIVYTQRTEYKKKNKEENELSKDQKQMLEKQRKFYNMSLKLDRINKLNQIVKTNSNVSTGFKEKSVQKRQPTNKSVFVDLYYPNPDRVRVYIDERKNFPYSTTMNQSNVQNNVNKFYIMQVLQCIDSKDDCYFFTRWGRVGLPGMTSEIGPISPQEAVVNFHSKLVQKLQKSYKQVQVTYESERRNFYFPKAVNKRKDQVVESKLDIRVQNLIRLIFDMKMMNNQMKQIGYDSKKMPLGKIAKSSIMKGYEALKELMEQIRGKKRKQSINQWSSLFYSHIPHDFGMKNLANYGLDTQQKVINKLQLLQSIQDIQIFTKLIDEVPLNEELNQLDISYSKLNIEIKPVEKDDPDYQMIIKYVQNTHAETHNTYNIQVDSIYKIRSQMEEDRYLRNLPNKQLLWHGSRLTNYVGILSQGLRIAPPEAPATGYMFGKGVYFADIVSKSANYCQASRVNQTACLLLCQVALGNPTEKYYADYNANLMTQDFHSTKGVGKSAPKQGQTFNNVYVPNGPISPTGISNTSLLYNEYVVYDICQIKIRYLLKIRCNFK